MLWCIAFAQQSLTSVCNTTLPGFVWNFSSAKSSGIKMITDRRNCAFIAASTFAIYYLSKKAYQCYQKHQVKKNIEKKLQSRKENFDIVTKLTTTGDDTVLQKRRDIINMGFEALRSTVSV